mmetsp:Transcript_4598/g.7004  ORF Transcript_4598/g.7004 Transcript_4598/m.7004 type:complete len:101 (+) Transcript_4598:1085-1387(+)
MAHPERQRVSKAKRAEERLAKEQHHQNEQEAEEKQEAVPAALNAKEEGSSPEVLPSPGEGDVPIETKVIDEKPPSNLEQNVELEPKDELDASEGHKDISS